MTALHVGQLVHVRHLGRGRIDRFHIANDGVFVRWEKSGLVTLVSRHLLIVVKEAA